MALFGKLNDLGNNLGDIGKIRDMIAEYIQFSRDAALTTIKNQHAIHARLAQIESKVGLPVQPLLIDAPPVPAFFNGAAQETPQETPHV